MKLFLLIGLVLSVLCAACGEDRNGADEAVPDGFARYEGPGVSFVHPAGWEAEEQETDDGVAVSLSEPGDRPGIGFAVAFERGGEFPADTLSFSDYAEQFDVLADFNLPEREVLRFEEIEVPGADEARLIEARYLWPDGDVMVRQYDVLTLQAERHQVPVFRISAPEEEWDEDAVRTILDSLHVS